MRTWNQCLAVIVGGGLVALSTIARAETPNELYLRAASYEHVADMPKAVYWYQQAAAVGDVDAQLHLGKLYREGKLIEQDYTQSAYYYGMAAEQGNPIAEYKLGTMYYGGQGVLQSNENAALWFKFSAAQGLPQAVHALEVMRMNGHCCNAALNVAALPSVAPIANPVAWP